MIHSGVYYAQPPCPARASVCPAARPGARLDECEKGSANRVGKCGPRRDDTCELGVSHGRVAAPGAAPFRGGSAEVFVRRRVGRSALRSTEPKVEGSNPSGCTV